MKRGIFIPVVVVALAIAMTLLFLSVPGKREPSGSFTASIPSDLGLASSIVPDGLVMYAENANTTPHYRIWSNASKNFLSQQNTLNVGAAQRWVTVRANHKRDEVIAGTVDKDNDINIQLYNRSTNTWYNLNEIATSTNSVNEQQLGIAYEQVSGDALIVYEQSSTNDNTVAFRTWDGTTLSAESLLTIGTSGAVHWVKAVQRPETDEIMVLTENSNNDIFAILWNGTAFVDSTAMNITLSATTKTQDGFDFAWEATGDQGLIVFVEDTGAGDDVYKYRTFNAASKTWSSIATFYAQNDGDGNTVRLCSDLTSSYIGFIGQDSKDDVNVLIWDGTGVETIPAPPSEDSSTVANNLGSVNADCTWEHEGSEAVFGFIDSGNSTKITYARYNKVSWSVSALENAEVSTNITSGDIEYLRFTPKPIENEIMAITLDTDEDARAIRWNGTAFVLPPTSLIEPNTECLNGNTECAQFVWFLIDPSLSIVKTDSPDPVSPGGLLNYSINITNTGLTIAFDVTLIEFYPSNVTFVNSSPAPTSGNNTWSLGTLSPGASTTVNITVNVSSTANGTILNNTVNVSAADTMGGANTTFSTSTLTTVSSSNGTTLMLEMPKYTINCTASVFQDFDEVTFYTCGDNASIGGSIICDMNSSGASSVTNPTNATTCDVGAPNFGALLITNNGTNATLNATVINITIGGINNTNVSLDNYIFDAVSAPGCSGANCNNCPAADTIGCFKDLNPDTSTPSSVQECDNFVEDGALCQCFSIHITDPDTIHMLKSGESIQFTVKKSVASPPEDPCT